MEPPKVSSPAPVKSLPNWAIILIFIGGAVFGAAVYASVRMVVSRPQLKSEGQPPANKVSDLIPDAGPATTTLPTDTATGTAPALPSNAYDTSENSLERQSFEQTADLGKLTLNVAWAKPEYVGIKKALTSVLEAKREEFGASTYEELKAWLSGQDAAEPFPTNEQAKGTWFLGKIKDGPYAGSSLYFRRVVTDSGYVSHSYHFMVSSSGKQARLLDSLYIEPGLGDPYDVSTPGERKMFIEAYGLVVPEDFKEGRGTLISENGHALNVEYGGFMSPGDPDSLYAEWLRTGTISSTPKIGKTKDGYAIYGELNGLRSYVQGGSGRFYLVASDVPTRVTENGTEVAKLVWDTVALAGRKTAKSYDAIRQGCGGGFWPTPPPEGEDLRSENLLAIGKTTEGDPVYMLKDMSKSPSARQAYEGWYAPEPDTKPSFETFLAQRPVPVIFWKDAFGRWAYYVDAEIMPVAECAKPVIYLYPTKTTDVSVALPRFINVTVSEPDYPARGWRTTARPDGTLTMADGQQYGSLYWEGTGVGYAPPQTGFVVKDGEQASFLSSTLAKYGLNKTEAKEFMDFWLPKMTGAPYYRVSFLTDAWSEAAPLYVSPKPDTSIRIFMDWQKLSAPMSLEEPGIVTPVRQGFTLVEWGGLLYKN